MCGKREPTVKRDRKSVIYTVGLVFASWVFYTTVEMTLKLITQVIQNPVRNKTLVLTKF